MRGRPLKTQGEDGVYKLRTVAPRSVRKCLCRLSPQSVVLHSCSPGNTVGLSGLLAVTCHHRKSKAREMGHTPGESGGTSGG